VHFESERRAELASVVSVVFRVAQQVSCGMLQRRRNAQLAPDLMWLPTA
jgi:hypothetical protein